MPLKVHLQKGRVSYEPVRRKRRCLRMSTGAPSRAKYWQSYLLAAKLRDLRSREHLTQAETAKRAGISESTLRNYELQKSSPKQSHLEALSKTFDVRPEALRLYDIDMFPANALFEPGRGPTDSCPAPAVRTAGGMKDSQSWSRRTGIWPPYWPSGRKSTMRSIMTRSAAMTTRGGKTGFPRALTLLIFHFDTVDQIMVSQQSNHGGTYNLPTHCNA